MTTKRRNEKTRLLLTLELAVILPAAALVLVSAWHVLHIQRDRAVEAAIQRDFCSGAGHLGKADQSQGV